MSSDTINQSMTEEDRAKFERGKELLGQVQTGKLFDDWWVPIGSGLLAVRRAVVKALHLKSASGGLYKNGFTKLCAGTPYADMKPVERSNLLYCMEHLDEITEMRAALTPTDRISINHPTSMVKHLKRYRDRDKDESSRRKNSSPMALLKEKNEELAKANLSFVKLIETMKQRDDFNPFDLKKDEPKHIADAIVSNVSLYKADAIRAQLGEAIKAKKQLVKQPAEKQGG